MSNLLHREVVGRGVVLSEVANDETGPEAESAADESIKSDDVAALKVRGELELAWEAEDGKEVQNWRHQDCGDSKLHLKSSLDFVRLVH